MEEINMGENYPHMGLGKMKLEKERDEGSRGDLVTKGGGNSLEVMILRGLYGLDKVEVIKFMRALLAGKFRQLRHLEISESGGLLDTGDDSDIRYSVSSIIPSKKLMKQRPNFCLVNKIY
ncbi:unnamed protein product [Lactuca saligna]|uniref:Uncharacterized protein n=1 Tax=Lactuca saligna TaxID=75948 RepID=A0AA35ZQY5_LACSI|nr:unnamed protein product [Lactuca saligna]